jgi:hypothetical protein
MPRSVLKNARFPRTTVSTASGDVFAPAFRNGKILRIGFCARRAAALEAVGLSE